jgi:hypothetical protein
VFHECSADFFQAAPPRRTIRAAMGYLEQFAQRTFAEETERITGGGARWQDPLEIRLEKVTIMSPCELCALLARIFRRRRGTMNADCT